MAEIVFVICLLTSFINFTNSIEYENIYNDEGWKPISNERAFYNQRINIHNSNNFENIDTWIGGAELSTENNQGLRNNVIRIITPQQIHSGFTIRREGSAHHLKEDNIGIRNGFEESSNIFNSKDLADGQQTVAEGESKLHNIVYPTHRTYKSYDYLEPTTENYLRKAKKISEASYATDNVTNFINEQNKNTSIEAKYIKRELSSSKNKYENENQSIYEVTETSQTSDFNTEQSKLLENTGYMYESPQQKRNQKKSSLSRNLSSALSKYSINSNDELSNYALSRLTHRKDNFKPNFIFVPIPLAGSHRYNKHVPVDKLLAVLLSNYGHYLPGLYGHQNYYKNLYGYLASNNIHNNKPFGSYKIFSDTDSSNK